MITAAEIAAATALLQAAIPFGEIFVTAIKSLLGVRFGGESYAQIEAQWQANLAEASKNAGLDPNPNPPSTSG